MNQNTLINYLKNKKIYVISPHFDDAVLSMGMLMYNVKQYGNTTVINACTKAHNGPYTLSSKKFIKDSGAANAEKLFHDRMKEDKKALTAINAKFQNLGLTDALFRRKTPKSLLGKIIPELNHLYPTYRWHVTKKIQPKDPAIEELKTKLQKLVPSDAVVFAPFGIGNHADHVITNHVCAAIFKNVFYYIDFPYDIRLKNFGTPPNGYEKFELPVKLAIKSGLIQHYQSQINGLFPQGKIPQHNEKFFLPKI